MAAWGLDQMTCGPDKSTRLFIYIAVSSQVAWVVVDNLLRALDLRQLAQMPGYELTVVLNRRRRSVFLPVFLDRAHTMWADGDDLLDLVLRHVFEVTLGQLLEDQVVAQAAGAVAGAFFLAKDAVTDAEVIQNAREVGHDLAALRIVGAHASQPQAVLLRPVKDGQRRLLDKLVALRCGHAQRVAASLQGQEELGAVVVFPRAGVHRAASQADDDG